jgi:hypothetical protein
MKEKVVPFPRTEVKEIFPFISSTSLLQMTSPRPEPLGISWECGKYTRVSAGIGGVDLAEGFEEEFEFFRVDADSGVCYLKFGVREFVVWKLLVGNIIENLLVEKLNDAWGKVETFFNVNLLVEKLNCWGKY